MERIIKTMDDKHRAKALDFVEKVFTEYQDANEGKTVRALVEEIRSKRYYLPELELLMCDAEDEIIGYVMFSRFHLEGKYEDELLLLSPVAVKTELQRQHISKELLEFGLNKARELGYQAVLVEGNPRNYRSRGFRTAADFGIVPCEKIKLPFIECLMVMELQSNALQYISGVVDYSFYETLSE